MINIFLDNVAAQEQPLTHRYRIRLTGMQVAHFSASSRGLLVDSASTRGT
jgi:hypothetical protein